MNKDIEMAFYNVLRQIINPRHMSIYKFKKGYKKIQFPCHNVKTIYWINMHDLQTISNNCETSLIVNGQHRCSMKPDSYYKLVQPYSYSSNTYILTYNCIKKSYPNLFSDCIKDNRVNLQQIFFEEYNNFFIFLINLHILPNIEDENEYEMKIYEFLKSFNESAQFINGINSFNWCLEGNMTTYKTKFIGGLDIKDYNDDVIVIVEHNPYFYREDKIFI